MFFIPLIDTNCTNATILVIRVVCSIILENHVEYILMGPTNFLVFSGEAVCGEVSSSENHTASQQHMVIAV